MANTIAVSILADAKDLQKNLDKAEGSVKDFAATADREAEKAGRSFDGLGESSDHMATASAQAAGGLGDLGGALQLLPGPLAGLGAGMEAAAPAIMGVTGASDLLNLATEKFPVLAKAQTLATNIMAGAQRALNAVMRANPIGLVITALLLLGTALFVAYKKSETFRNIVNGAWAGIRAAVGAAWNAIRPIFNAYKAYLSLIGTAATNVWHTTRDAFDNIWNKIKGLPGKVSGLAGSMKDAGSKIIGHLVDGLMTVGGKAGSIATDIANKLIDGLNRILPHKLNTHIPGVGTVGLFPNIPHLATGGITNGPTLALIGDNPSGREAVIPLDRNGNSPFGGNTYNIYVSAGVGDPVAIGKEVKRYLAAADNAGVRTLK